jgi:hypothetical protein
VDSALNKLGAAVASGVSSGGSSGGAADAAAATWGEKELDHNQVWPARTLAVLRILLLESRAQLHLLSSNFSAARSDLAANLALHGHFPVLLESLRPCMHMQVALYAHAVGAWAAAGAHYTAAAAASDPLAEGRARSLAAMARLAQGGPDAGALRGLCFCLALC